MSKRIPHLNCLWNDVLHFSPINPQRILDCWRENALYVDANPIERQVFKIPAELIDWDNAVCFQSYNFAFGKRDPELDKFWKISRTDYREQLEVHPDQIRVWKEDRAAGRRLLWFSHTMHVLSRQTLEISELEVFTCR